VWSYVSTGGRPFYLWQMGLSVGWGFLVSPGVALIGILTFLENELADFVYMHQIQYHYSMPLVPVLVLGTAWGISRLRTPGWRAGTTAVVTGAALVSCVLWGLAPFSERSYPHLSPHSAEVRDTNAALAALPPGAVVSAFYPFVSHIDHRTRVYMWPTPFSAKYWGLYTEEGKRLPVADQVQYLALPTDLTGSDRTVFASVADRYRIVKQVGEVALYKRIGS
jgi:hypothetical protein